MHDRVESLLKPTVGIPTKFQHLTKAEKCIITRFEIDLTKATKSHILFEGPQTTCHHCGQTLIIGHIHLECTVLQKKS